MQFHYVLQLSSHVGVLILQLDLGLLVECELAGRLHLHCVGAVYELSFQLFEFSQGVLQFFVSALQCQFEIVQFLSQIGNFVLVLWNPSPQVLHFSVLPDQLFVGESEFRDSALESADLPCDFHLVFAVDGAFELSDASLMIFCLFSLVLQVSIESLHF